AGGLHHQGHRIERYLRFRYVVFRRVVAIQGAVTDVADDADDLAPLQSPGINRYARAQALADGVFAGKVFIDELLVDDDDRGGLVGVALAEVAPLDHPYAHGPEVIEADGAIGRRGTLTCGQGPAFGFKRDRHIAVAERQRRDGAGRFDARQRGQPRLQLAEEFRLLFRAVLHIGHAQVKRHDVVRVDAGVDALQAPQALNQQAGSDQQDDGDGDFDGHQRAAQRHAPPAF